jgi:hypothetical protein
VFGVPIEAVFRQSEIGDLWFVECRIVVGCTERHAAVAVARRQQHVARLQIAMHDAALVRVVSGPSQPAEQLGGGPRRQRRLIQDLVEPAAGDEFHGEIRAPVVRADFEYLYDVRMEQPRGRLGLHLKPLQLAGAGKVAGQDHLQRDLAIEADLPRAIDHAHAAAPDLFDQLVVPHSTSRRTDVGCHDRDAAGDDQRPRPLRGDRRAGRRVAAHLPVHLDELLKVRSPLRKPREPVVARRVLVQLSPHHILGVDQVDREVGVGGEFRVARQVFLGRAAFPGAKPPSKVATGRAKHLFQLFHRRRTQ